MSPEDEVHQVSAQFYAGLNSMAGGNSAPLADIWSHQAAVMTMHPVGGRQVGWEAVKESFHQVAQLASEGKIALKDQIIHVAGEVAYEVGIEHGHITLAGKHVAIEQRVTNIYQRQGGAWKMVHHHADLSAAMLDVVRGLQRA